MGKIIVIYGGGFQPFHAGHLSSYKQAKEEFSQYPNVEFYVTASDNTNTRPIPFKEKQWLARQAGVPEQDFRNVAVKSPLNPVEILSQYDPNSDIFILVRSERDPVSYQKKDGSPGYYQPFKSIKNCKPFNSKNGHGYVFVTKKEDFEVAGQEIYSGTQVRDLYAISDDKMRNIIVRDMYPNSPNQLKIKQILNKYIGVPEEPKATTVKPKTNAIKKLKADPLKENALEIIKRARPLLKEASVEQKIKFIKLMKEASKLDELNLFKRPQAAQTPPKNNDPRDQVEQPDDYHTYFAKKDGKEKVYKNTGEYYDDTKIDPLKETDVEEGRVILPKMVNLYLQLRKPGAKPILVNKNNPIPYKAIDSLIDNISSKYNNVYPDMFSFVPADKENMEEGLHDAEFIDNDDSFYNMAEFAHKEMRKGKSLQDIIKYLVDNNYLDRREVNVFVKQVNGEKWNESVEEDKEDTSNNIFQSMSKQLIAIGNSADKVKHNSPDKIHNAIDKKLEQIDDPKLQHVTKTFLQKAVNFNRSNPKTMAAIFGFTFAIIARVSMGISHAQGLSPTQATLILEATLPTLGNFLGYLINGFSVKDSIQSGLIAGSIGVAGVGAASMFTESEDYLPEK